MAGEAQKEALLIALTTLLSADAALTALAPGGVHLVRAPQPADSSTPTVYPLVVVRIRPGGRITQTLGVARAMREVYVEVVGWTLGAGTSTAHRIDERIEALLADLAPAVTSPWSAGPMRRTADVDGNRIESGVEIDAVGGLYRVGLSGG